MDCISEAEISKSKHCPLLGEVLRGIQLITERAGDACGEYSLRLFTVVLRISASKHTLTLGHMVRVKGNYSTR